MVRVHAAKPFSLSSLTDFEYEAPDNPDIHVQGRGRVFGVVLTQNHAQRVDKKADNDGPVLMALRYGMCTGSGCTAVRGGVNIVIGFGPGLTARDDRSFLLRAGDYDLYLLTDGAPVTVRMTLHGLSGTSSVRPTTPVSAPLAEAVPTDPSGTHYASDERHAFRGLGLVAVSLLTRSDAITNPRTSYCLTRTTSEDTSATDPVDAEAGCAATLAGALAAQGTGQDPGNFHGHLSASGHSISNNWPAGRIDTYSSFDPGVYRNQVTANPTPADDSRSFTTLWLPWH